MDHPNVGSFKNPPKPGILDPLCFRDTAGTVRLWEVLLAYLESMAWTLQKAKTGQSKSTSNVICHTSIFLRVIHMSFDDNDEIQ